jgi:hypothetical protein
MDLAEPIRILILDYVADELGAALAKLVKRLYRSMRSI